MTIRHALVGAAIALVTAGLVSAQAQRSPATLDDLLAEVRALRGDLNQSSAVSTRALLLAARVQVQEHRISEASRLLVELQREADFVTRRREGLTETLKVLEERRPTLPAAQRAENEEHIRGSIERVQEETQRESALRQRLTDASNALFLEQNRWAEFTSRLDELERTLSR
jgi:uncharacterized membrane-anchored protein YhcB (DUF1043 family)